MPTTDQLVCLFQLICQPCQQSAICSFAALLCNQQLISLFANVCQDLISLFANCVNNLPFASLLCNQQLTDLPHCHLICHPTCQQLSLFANVSQDLICLFDNNLPTVSRSAMCQQQLMPTVFQSTTDLPLCQDLISLFANYLSLSTDLPTVSTICYCSLAVQSTTDLPLCQDLICHVSPKDVSSANNCQLFCQELISTNCQEVMLVQTQSVSPLIL